MRPFALGVVALLLAGCVSAVDEPDEPSTNATATLDADRPDPTFSDLPNAVLGQLAAPDENASLDAPPRLVPGEWWRIRFTSALTDETVEFVRVVAKVEPHSDACDASSPQAGACGGYVIGMPHEGWYKEAVIYHVPFFGDVELDLSGRAHDVPFVPLQFPLTEGATWETHFETTNKPLTAAVTLESRTEARVTFTGPQCSLLSLMGPCPEGSQVSEVMTLVYDAKMHEIREWTHAVGHHYEVLQHGYGFQGWVTVPRGEDLVFFHGRIGSPLVGLALEPAPPVETVNVAGGFNRVSFILGAGTLAAQGGAFRERVVAPDGTEYLHESIPGAPMTFRFLEHPDPDGEWQLEHVAAGAGYVFIEGIAYHQYDIRLPDGAVRSDHAHEVVR